MKKMVAFIVVIGSLLLAACQAQQPVPTNERSSAPSGGSYSNVDANKLNGMLKNKDFVFVNVHIPFEGDIANTDLSIPYDQIAEPAYLAQLPADKNTKIVLYCRSGRMSALASEVLVKMGYTNIWNLEGGMIAWEQAGFELQGK